MYQPNDREDPAPVAGGNRTALPKRQDPAYHGPAAANSCVLDARELAGNVDRDDRRIQYAMAIWDTTTPAAGTPVRTYLAVRGIRIPAPACLRFHPELNHRCGGRWAGMVALIQRAGDGEPIGIHRTYLTPDGFAKAPVDPTKMMLGYAKGGVARLAEPQDGMPLLIGEGIETCLSVTQATGWPAWAALSAGNFVKLDLPEHVRDVLILADCDDGGVGAKAAENAAAKWHREGRRIRIARAPEGQDFNDVLLEDGGADIIRRICHEVETWKPDDPFADLVERTKHDAGAPFADDALARLVELKRKDPSGFETLRARLKAAGCRVSQLDKAIHHAAARGGEEEESPTQTLLRIAAEAELFTAADVAYADFCVEGHRETWPVRTRGFRRWMTNRFLEESGGLAPNAEAMQAAINALDAIAHFDNVRYDVFVRVGAAEGRLYLDLCDDGWRAVEIDDVGWRIVANPPVRFRRQPGMLPLPVPVRGGALDELRPFLNTKSADGGIDENFMMAVAWLLGCFREQGPYPLLCVAGPQGSAKTTACALIRSLIDPAKPPSRSLPREEREAYIAANNAFVLSFDNISWVPSWLSDVLCRISTGGGYAVRQLYTDCDEIIFNATRPILLTSIDEAVITRGDLADRAIFLTLEAIPEEDRRLERDIGRRFEAARPRILGALLDAVAEGLRRLPQTKLDRLPRLADFALWVSACETALWEPGAFMRVYGRNLEQGAQNVIESSPVAQAIVNLVGTQDFEGTATDLLDLLEHKDGSGLNLNAGSRETQSKSWPKNARALSATLRRIAPALLKKGVEVIFEREGGKGGKKIVLTELKRKRRGK